MLTMQQQQVITTTTINQPVIQAEQSHDSRIYHKYSNQTSLVLGALQVVIGLLCIFFNLAAILLGAAHGRVSHGFWCGIVFIVGGIFGIKAAGLKTGCWITSFLVFSIVNAVLCVFLLSIAADGIQKDKTESCYWGVCFSTYSSASNKETREGQVAVNGFLVGLALAEIIFSIWSSAICCAAVCCGNSAPPPGVIKFVNIPNQAQVTYITPGTQTIIQPGVQTSIPPTVTTGATQMMPVAQVVPYAPPPYTTSSQGYCAPPEAGMSPGTQQTREAPQIPQKTAV